MCTVHTHIGQQLTRDYLKLNETNVFKYYTSGRCKNIPNIHIQYIFKCFLIRYQLLWLLSCAFFRFFCRSFVLCCYIYAKRTKYMALLSNLQFRIILCCFSHFSYSYSSWFISILAALPFFHSVIYLFSV